MEDNYLKTQQHRLAQHLKDLFEPKTYSEEWSVMYYACIFFTPIAQVISASLALGVPAYFGRILFGSWFIGLSIGLVAVVIFELMKRNIAGIAAKMYYKSTLSTKLRLSVAAFMLGSIAMSGFGTPILVKEFAPMPTPPTEADIVGKQDSANAAQLARFEQIKAEARKSASAIHSQNNWKGVTVTAARGNILQLEAQAKAASDSIASLSAAYHIERKNALYAAQVEHEKAVAERKAEIENVGWIFAAICLIFEVLFLFATFWIYDYKYHQYCEIEPAILSKQAPKQTVKHHSAQQIPAQQIGFHSEGKVIDVGGKKLIFCLMNSGELKPFDASQLSTRIANTSNGRKEYFKRMKEKLDSEK